MKNNLKIILEATSTPLASIFGSGFLVIVPILAGAVGIYSIVAMAGVCALAYAMGCVIRYDIKHAEPVLAGKPSEATLSFERASDLAFVVAYVISICLYLHILSSFVLGGFHLDTELNQNLMATGIIVVIMVVGLTKTLEIVAIASRAFAFYYMLQCLVAITVSKSTGRRIALAAIAIVLAFITIFAVPAS